MQITLVLSGDTVSDVLNRFETKFFPECPDDELKKKFSRSMVAVSEYLITYSIRELKAMADFLSTAFKVCNLDAPKRNLKVSLANWIVQVLLSAREVEDSLEAIADQIADSSVECPNCGFVHGPFQNSLCTYRDPSPEIEVLEPEKKPVYKISIHPDRYVGKEGWAFIKEQVSALPPYLLDRQGDLFEKSSSYTASLCDASYVQRSFQHLSNIAVDSGLVVKLMTEDLEVSRACICGDAPPFIVDRGGVYKRDRLRSSLAVRYAQVVSEYLSNIVVV